VGAGLTDCFRCGDHIRFPCMPTALLAETHNNDDTIIGKFDLLYYFHRINLKFATFVSQLPLMRTAIARHAGDPKAVKVKLLLVNICFIK
jgi:hypothetical protein